MLPPHSLPTAGMDARFQVIAGAPASPRCSIISAQPLVLNSPKTVISALARGFFSLLRSTRKHVCARARATSQWAAEFVTVSIEDVQLESAPPPPPLPSMTECARVTKPAREISRFLKRTDVRVLSERNDNILIKTPKITVFNLFCDDQRSESLLLII